MLFTVIKSEKQLEQLVEEAGFLPFFRNAIEGFSVEECILPELWFSEKVDGPWEWKGPVIRGTRCAYGKFYRGKAVFIARRFFPDFANFRRDGYDYDARMDDGLARNRDIPLMQELWESKSILSKELKARICFTKQRKASFEGSLTRLQMLGYINVADFEYAIDKYGKPYGWGLARYTTPEAFFGAEFSERVYSSKPKESYEKLSEYLRKLLPHASLSQIESFLGGNPE